MVQVCHATLQLIDVLLQCPLAAVFLRELVFGSHFSLASTTHTSTSPASLTEDGKSITGERKKLEDSVSRFV